MLDELILREPERIGRDRTQRTALAVDAGALARRTTLEIDALFDALPAPDTEELRPRMHGRLVAVSFLDALPAPIRAAIFWLLALPLNPWRAKSFDEIGGANWWGVARGQLSFASYRVLREVSPNDGRESVLLDYAVDATPAPLRAILGELRRLSAGVLLGRMFWRGKAGATRILYFTLEG
ncbi:hypothetical protein K8I61_16965 [bacterium]|nr:hypothetical protein [bacterium]